MTNGQIPDEASIDAMEGDDLVTANQVRPWLRRIEALERRPRFDVWIRRRQRIIVAALAISVLMFVVPPWLEEGVVDGGWASERPAGYSLLFTPPDARERERLPIGRSQRGSVTYVHYSVQLDWERLKAQASVVWLVTATLLVWPRKDAGAG